MRNARISGMLVAGMIVMLGVLLLQLPAIITTVAASPTASNVSWMPLAWYGASPWKPTATPTPTATSTATATSTPTATRTPTITPTPTPALSIRALVYAGTNEYVEVFNAGPGSQALTGWKLRSVIGDQWYDFPWGMSLSAGEWLRVHSGPDAVDVPPRHLRWSGAYIWNNEGDEAELFDGDGRLVDRWGY